MPYSSVTELPDAVRSRYSERCQGVFMRAFNNAAKNGSSEADAFKVGHTAAGMCREAGKASKAEPLDADEMDAWFAGKIPRRLLAIPFSGPIPGPNGKSRDLDMEYFDERTDIKPDWFDERPVDWHHSQDPSGKMNGVLIGKAKNLHRDDEGWWVDLWLNAGEKRLGLVRKLAEKGAELYGSSYAYPNLVKRDPKGTGHIQVWPYMMQTLSTSPQNTNSVHRPAKAVLDAFTQADIAVEPILADVLTELDVLRDLDADPTGEAAAKAGRELSGANLREIEEWREFLDELTKRVDAMQKRVITKYHKPEGVPSNP